MVRLRAVAMVKLLKSYVGLMILPYKAKRILRIVFQDLILFCTTNITLVFNCLHMILIHLIEKKEKTTTDQ